MPNLTPSEAIAKIRERYVDIDRLKVFAASQYEPDAGSELAIDDLDWPYLRVSETARYGLAAAVDHLDCYRFLVEQRRLFPPGQLTLVRAAIVGAAQAVWVLAPDDRDARIERGRTAAVEWYRQHLLHTKALLPLSSTEAGEAAELVRFLTERLQELEVKRDADRQRARYEATAIIRQAALETYGQPGVGGDPESYANEAVAEWRRTSGVAHGLSWAQLSGAARDATDAGNGMAWFGVSADINDSLNPFLLASHLLRPSPKRDAGGETSCPTVPRDGQGLS